MDGMSESTKFRSIPLLLYFEKTLERYSFMISLSVTSYMIRVILSPINEVVLQVFFWCLQAQSLL